MSFAERWHGLLQLPTKPDLQLNTQGQIILYTYVLIFLRLMLFFTS